jgi:hypothetical protein
MMDYSLGRHQVPLPPEPGSASGSSWSDPDETGVLSDGAQPVEHPVDNQGIANFQSAMGRIVIIEPVGTEEVKRKFIGKSLAMVKLLNESPFANAGIEDVKVNFRNVTISVQVQNKNSIVKLLEIKSLGTQPVKCTQPTSHWEVKGVISGIGLDVTEEEIIEAVNEQNIKIARAIRLNIGKEKTPSLSIKLIFVEGVKVVPDHIRIGYQRFSVRAFTEKLLQCFKCQGFGHSSKRCGAREKCVYCAGNHRLSECPKEQIKCANCDGTHTSSYSKCPRLVEAKEVNDIRVGHKLTFREAVLRHRTSGPATDAARPAQGATRPVIPQVNRHTDANNNAERRYIPETLTMAQASSANETKNCLDKEELCAFIIEMLQALMRNTKEESSQTQGEIVTSVTKKVFGSSVDTEKIIAILKKGQKQKRSRTDSERSDPEQMVDEHCDNTDHQSQGIDENQESRQGVKAKKKKKKQNQSK